MHQHLGVGAGAKHVSARLELAPHIQVVVQLAIEDHPDALILIGHRLCAAFDVYDAQTPMPQTDRPIARVVEP